MTKMIKIKSFVSLIERNIRTVGKKTFIDLFPVRYNSIKMSQILKTMTYSNRKMTNKLYSQNGISYKKNAMLWLIRNNCEKDVLRKIMTSKRVSQNIKNQAMIYYNNLT